MSWGQKYLVLGVILKYILKQEEMTIGSIKRTVGNLAKDTDEKADELLKTLGFLYEQAVIEVFSDQKTVGDNYDDSKYKLRMKICVWFVKRRDTPLAKIAQELNTIASQLELDIADLRTICEEVYTQAAKESFAPAA